jgi:inorganic pyrophosphatase
MKAKLIGFFMSYYRKVITIDVNDPLASKMNDIEDVEKYMPGLLRATNEWFRIYKIPDGKGENTFAFSGEAKNKRYADQVILECEEAWKRLIMAEIPNATEKYDIKTVNVDVENSPYKVEAAHESVLAIPKADPKPPASIDPSIDKWFFLSGRPNL